MEQKRDLSETRAKAVQAELDRLCESAAFRSSKRCREFLSYIVQHTLRGPSDTLKERSIGVELFQLPADFDTSQHTIVRVTANEVRKRLAQYYLSENGAHHQVKIELPPGSYSAAFRWETPAAETLVAARPNWTTRAVVVGTTAVLVSASVLLLWPRDSVTPAGRDNKTTSRNDPPINAAFEDKHLRMIAGSANAYTDRSGRSWGPDRFFAGGSVLVRPSERILRTMDPDIYRHLRQGDFRYDIPLAPGSYELHLHFAETGIADNISAESSGEGTRLFHVAINGKRALNIFDVIADAAGRNIADERVFRNVSPAPDGFLHLDFSSMRGAAILSGIELLPVSPGKVRPIRIRAGWPASWQNSAGQSWQADSYFLGGNALVRHTNPAGDNNSIQPDMVLYTSERWGHFSYALPVAEGRYRVTLKFCEGHYGARNTGIGGVGSRAFDVYCNGVALLREFDIFKAAGGEGRPVERTFSDVRPNAQGKIILTFVPVVGMACVNGIEVVEDSK